MKRLHVLEDGYKRSRREVDLRVILKNAWKQLVGCSLEPFIDERFGLSASKGLPLFDLFGCQNRLRPRLGAPLVFRRLLEKKLAQFIEGSRWIEFIAIPNGVVDLSE